MLKREEWERERACWYAAVDRLAGSYIDSQDCHALRRAAKDLLENPESLDAWSAFRRVLDGLQPRVDITRELLETVPC